MLRKLYDRTMALAASKNATRALFGVSFAESSFFPIPPDLLLVPMVLSRRERWIWYATVATIGSVVGGIVGYLIGVLLFEQVAQPILSFYGYGAEFASFQQRFNEYGVWIVIIAGVTPFPYKVITIASGATGLSFPLFVVASIFARGLRFFIVSALLYVFGPPIRAFIEKRLALVLGVLGVLAVAGFAAVKLL